MTIKLETSWLLSEMERKNFGMDGNLRPDQALAHNRDKWRLLLRRSIMQHPYDPVGLLDR